MSQTPILDIINVSKSYKVAGAEKNVLNAVSIDVKPGEWVVILGKSGSGKSTLLNIAGGMDDADKGSVRLDGKEMVGLNDDEKSMIRRHKLGFVFQFFNLVPTLTVLENCLLPLELVGQTGAKADSVARGLLNELGLSTYENRYPDTLSGGEQQRVAIARALVHNPKLLIADEPTGNLDQKTSEAVLALFDEVVRKRGISLLMATHSLDVLPHADRVFDVREGKVVLEEAVKK